MYMKREVTVLDCEAVAMQVALARMAKRMDAAMEVAELRRGRERDARRLRCVERELRLARLDRALDR